MKSPNQIFTKLPRTKLKIFFEAITIQRVKSFTDQRISYQQQTVFAQVKKRIVAEGGTAQEGFEYAERTLRVSARTMLILLGAAMLPLEQAVWAGVVADGNGNFTVSGSFTPSTQYTAAGGSDSTPEILVESSTNVDYASAVNDFFRINADGYTVTVEAGAFIRNNSNSSENIFVSTASGSRTIYNIAGELQSGSSIVAANAAGSPTWDIRLSGTIRNPTYNTVLLGQGGNDRLTMQAGSLIESGNGRISLRGGADELIYNGGRFDGLVHVDFDAGDDLLELNATPDGMPSMWGGSGADTLRLNNSGSFDLSSLDGGWDILDMNGTAWTLSGRTASNFANGVDLAGGGALTLDITGGDQSIAGDITGSGSLIKTGSNSLTLTGTNTYTGATTVNAGILSVNGSISNSTTTVNSGGTLGGTGTVGDVFINGGTFAPGNSIGTINVSGNVDFTGGGNYDVEVDAAGNSDKIVATGSATLTGGIVNVKAALGTYAYTTDYTILTATGGLGGTTFDSVNANLAFLTPTLSYDANNVFLKLTRNDVSFSDVASTRNQRAVAMAIDNNTSQLSDLVSQITPLSSLAARQAFDSLSGVQHSNNQLITRSVASQFNQLLLNHGSQSGSGSLAFNNQFNASGMSSGSASGLPQQRGWWAQGFGSFNDIDDSHNARGADYQTSGLAFGIDADWHEFVMGVAGSYAHTDVDPYSGNSTIDSYQAATYGSWQQDQLYVNASLGFGLHKVDASRTVTMGSLVSTAKADYDSFDVNSTIETGKDFAFGADTTLTPFAGVSYLYNSRDGFTEKGAGAANLKVDKENDESLLTSIGLRLSHDIHMADKRILTPVASIAYVHEHMDSVSTLNANFKNVSGSNFSIEGPELDRDRLQLALGVTGQLTSSTSLVLGYYGEFADSHQNNALTATLDVSF